MLIKELRITRGWSQEQLAELSGLNVRTIQRLEQGATPGLETLKSLAATFGIDIDQLRKDVPMSTLALPKTPDAQRLAQITAEVKCRNGFYLHLAQYVLIMSVLLVINLYSSPHYFWVIYPALGWGVGLAAHGLCVSSVTRGWFERWQRREIERRLAAGDTQQR
ncbi:helix-turn-helix domain-containing protein [Jeongeupia sp. HS-3]|uniref:helix-turn-helix domain-containing protein n=1 Tax=Jeongeupia sp. HS-3 TaxID=1009682 RepID=UPI00190FCD5B|nr:helix-turn-helix domain-containing protein [Jeongeupia sp. HS-3]